MQQFGDPVTNTQKFRVSNRYRLAVPLVPFSPMASAPSTVFREDTLVRVRRHKHQLTTSSSIRVYSLRFLAPDWKKMKNLG